MFIRGVALDFEGVRVLEGKLDRRIRSKQGGVYGCTPQENFLINFTVLEMPFPAFSAGHFQYINTKENTVRGTENGRCFRFSPHYNVSCCLAV